MKESVNNHNVLENTIENNTFVETKLSKEPIIPKENIENLGIKSETEFREKFLELAAYFFDNYLKK